MKLLLKAHQLWDNKQDSPKTENTHAHHAIVNNLDKTLIHLVLDTVDASDAWERLKSQYKKLIAHDFAIGTLEDGFNRVATLERNLTASNGSDSIKITDLTVLIGISSLPSHFNNVRSIIEKDIENEEAEALTLENVRNRVLREHELQNVREKKVDHSSFLAKRQCEHHRESSSCWKFHPEKAPTCNKCKAAGLHYRHYENTKTCANVSKTNAKPAAMLAVKWVADYGCSNHMVNNKDHLDFYAPQLETIHVANGTNMTSEGTGSMSYQANNFQGIIKNIIHCPSFSHNLRSISKFSDHVKNVWEGPGFGYTGDVDGNGMLGSY
ncbi:hypothetical protein O9G_000752 [Rozella allomycis CSF55]|uniref:Retrovirus-related Pol polyprotein from transposon TNT 1-94-like beta-barrel domain-containing protein n=1 Tax=Rozella allomycis (strain CSF55) TaxID=988480 RepID=A0A075B307_ROZAC|nr:hypothetical protein O9G_000752 [Rozella allomycis CSF55]|eukprot:EPZ35356.1 hypothetical protein O9G_000752 [Rozella allomycis CSF55]